MLRSREACDVLGMDEIKAKKLVNYYRAIAEKSIFGAPESWSTDKILKYVLFGMEITSKIVTIGLGMSHIVQEGTFVYSSLFGIGAEVAKFTRDGMKREMKNKDTNDELNKVYLDILRLNKDKLRKDSRLDPDIDLK